MNNYLILATAKDNKRYTLVTQAHNFEEALVKSYNSRLRRHGEITGIEIIKLTLPITPQILEIIKAHDPKFKNSPFAENSLFLEEIIDSWNPISYV